MFASAHVLSPAHSSKPAVLSLLTSVRTDATPVEGVDTTIVSRIYLHPAKAP